MHSILFQGVEYRVFDRLYAVSRNGDLLRQFTPYTPTAHPLGYLVAGRQRLVHRVVATCWLDKPEGANHVHHKNGNKADNRADNLEWVTPKTHAAHHKTWGHHEMSEAGKMALRQFRTGRVTTEETKQKQREASLRLGCRPPSPEVGYKHTARSISRMSENSPNRRACKINGIEYRSFNEAGKALGIRPHTLRKRCLSAGFSDYQLLG